MTPQSRIPEFPPELVADRGNFDGASRLGSIFNEVDNARGSKKRHHHDQDRNQRPGRLDLIAAMNF